MKNILIITPFYPLNNIDRKLNKDTNAIYYLASNKMENENIIILYYYQQRKLSAFLSFFRLLKNKDYKKCLYKDEKDNDVLLFEHPFVIPSYYKTFNFFDKKYAKFVNTYLNQKGIELDSIIVHFPSANSNIIKYIDAKKKTCIVHAVDISSKKRFKDCINGIDLVDQIGFRSKIIMNSFENLFLNKEKFLCLSGIPKKYIVQENINKEWMNNGVLNIIYAGNLDKNKNVFEVVKALSSLNNRIKFVFTIIGDGKEISAIRKYLIDNDIKNIHLLGRMEREDVYKYMLKSDLFIMLSHRETLGLVYLEAISAGCIVFFSKNTGIDGVLVDEKSGFSIDSYSMDELKKKIVFINNLKKEDAINIKKNAFEIIKDLDENTVSRFYLNKC